MFKAKYIQRGESLDYTPVSDTPAGSVVFLGTLCGITKLDIKAGELGALAIKGVYEFVKPTGTAIAAGAALYWDEDNGRVTTTPNANYIGVAIAAAASDDTAVRAVINEGESGYAGGDDSSSSSPSSSSSSSSSH